MAAGVRCSDRPDSSPRVCVILVAYHAEPWLSNCLGSLAEASRNRLRLVLVDNGGNGSCIPRALPDFDYRVLETSQSLGFAEANNFALGHEIGGQADLICFLNQDTTGAPGWIDECVACLDDRPQAEAVAPLLRNYDDTGWDAGFLDCARTSPEFARELSAGCCESPFAAVQRVTAAAMIVRTAALRRAGPFDPVFGSYCEDYDLCRRIRQTGAEIGICTRAVVRHYSGSSTTTPSAERKRMRQIYRNRVFLRVRESGAGRLSAVARYLTCTLPRNLARGALRTASSQPLAVQLAANWDLLCLWRRLVSSRCDEQAWAAYLAQIDWPDAARAKAASA